MALRVWLLVEWVDESNVFPAYGVVNVDTRAYNDSDLQPTNLIYISVKHDNPKRAKLLRISESKRYVLEQKEILERQDQQVKNMLQLCMRTIQEIKTEPYGPTHHTTILNNTIAARSHVVVANDGSNSNDSDAEPNPVLPDRSRIHEVKKFNPRHRPQYSRTPQANRTHSQISNNQSRRSLVSSTPLPGILPSDSIKLFLDQGTQTEDNNLQMPVAKIEELEAVLKNLYGRFNSLVAQADRLNATLSMSESEQNDISYAEPHNGDPWVDDNNTGYIDQGNGTVENAHHMDVEQVANNGEEPINLVSSNVKTEEIPNTVRVRRMSAQTTNNIESGAPSDTDLVPIGSGHAKVPARLLNDIDWTSHTNATRQLLQAIFPRRVLATHSLTGKQSPAFLHKPPKKILDPQLVDDIVKQVSTQCGVPRNLVRNSITIKCTDEAKLYRNRQSYKHARKPTRQNEENVPPSTPSSDEISNVMN